MKDIVRTLDFYEFDKDCTMYDVNSYSISKVVEVENEKYVKQEAKEEADDSTTTSGNTVNSDNTVNSGDTEGNKAEDND